MLILIEFSINWLAMNVRLFHQFLYVPLYNSLNYWLSPNQITTFSDLGILCIIGVSVIEQCNNSTAVL